MVIREILPSNIADRYDWLATLETYKARERRLKAENARLRAALVAALDALAAAPNPWPSPYPAGTPGPICEKLRAYDLWDIQRQAALVTS